MDLEEYSRRHPQIMTTDLPPLLDDTAAQRPLGRLVDLGAGDGTIMWALQSRFERGVGVDLSPVRIARLGQLLPDAEAVVADACDTGLRAGTADSIVCSQVIEHVEDDAALASEIKRLLSPTGWFYVGTVLRRPRSFWIYRRDGRWWLDPTHLREYASAEQLTSVLTGVGLTVEQVRVSPCHFPMFDMALRAVRWPRSALSPTRSSARSTPAGRAAVGSAALDSSHRGATCSRPWGRDRLGALLGRLPAGLRPEGRLPDQSRWPGPAMRALGMSDKTASSDPVVPEELLALRTTRRRVTRGVLVLSAITLAGSAVNYASNLAFARVLTPASYGDLSSLLALSVVVAVPFAAAQTRVASRVAAHASENNWERVQYTVRNSVAHLGLLAILATLVYCASIPLIKHLFHLQAIGPAIALAALIFVSYLFPALQGTLQGLERWVAFGVVGLSVACMRLLLGIPWALAGGGAGGAIAGQAIGMLFCLAGLVWLLRPHVRRTGNAAAWAGIRRRPDITGVAAGAAYVFFAVIANFDVVLAKVFLSPREAGGYAALSTIGSIVTFLPAAVAVIVVPSAIRAGESARERTHVLRLSAMMVAVAASVAIIPAILAPTFVVRVMFGTRYLANTSGVLPIVCAGGGLALLYLLVTYTVTIEDTRWTWLLAIGVILQFALIALFHASVTQVAGTQAVTVLVLLVINEVRFHSLLPWPSRG
jgi:O-antigen/teichoic acid export membrane protein/SAM-dependent methyltransferase